MEQVRFAAHPPRWRVSPYGWPTRRHKEKRRRHMERMRSRRAQTVTTTETRWAR